MKNKIGKLKYLPGSIVFYGKEPILVHDVIDNSLEFRMLVNEEVLRKEISDTKFNFSAPSGGMMFQETNNFSGLLVRTPRRNWKQGMTEGNTRLIMIGHTAPTHSINFRTDLAAIRKTLLLEYPSFEEALEKSREVNSPIPFHKYFSVDSDNKLYYKTFLAGDCEGKTVKMEDAFSVLQDMCLGVVNVS